MANPIVSIPAPAKAAPVASAPVPAAKPAPAPVPFVRQALTKDGRPTGLVRVGGKGTRMPPPKPSRPPEPGTFLAHAQTRGTKASALAGARNHARLQDNSELSLEEFDALVKAAGEDRLSGR